MNCCPKCGEQAASNYCPNCGTKMNVPAERSKAPDASSYYTSKEISKDQPQDGKEPASKADPSQYKMGWHKWVVNFVLWLWAAIGLLNCVTFPYYRDAYGIVGVGYGLFAIACVYVRFQVAGFKVGAPKKLLILSICQAVLAMAEAWVYMNAASLPMEAAPGSNVIVVLAWAIGNWRYYSSRSELFVN